MRSYHIGVAVAYEIAWAIDPRHSADGSETIATCEVLCPAAPMLIRTVLGSPAAKPQACRRISAK